MSGISESQHRYTIPFTAVQRVQRARTMSSVDMVVHGKA